jgi:hypothetical protein
MGAAAMLRWHRAHSACYEISISRVRETTPFPSQCCSLSFPNDLVVLLARAFHGSAPEREGYPPPWHLPQARDDAATASTSPAAAPSVTPSSELPHSPPAAGWPPLPPLPLPPPPLPLPLPPSPLNRPFTSAAVPPAAAAAARPPPPLSPLAPPREGQAPAPLAPQLLGPASCACCCPPCPCCWLPAPSNG